MGPWKQAQKTFLPVASKCPKPAEISSPSEVFLIGLGFCPSLNKPFGEAIDLNRANQISIPPFIWSFLFFRVELEFSDQTTLVVGHRSEEAEGLSPDIARTLLFQFLLEIREDSFWSSRIL